MNPQDTLQQVLALLAAAAGAAQAIAPLTGPEAPAVAAGGAIAAQLLAIAEKAVAAYESHTGQPIDLSALHKIEPIP